MTYQVTFIDNGQTLEMTESEAVEWFGVHEWEEVKAGYLPHIVVA